MPSARDYFAIHNLLYRYCDAVDRADSGALNAMFAHADVYPGALIKAGSTPGFGDVLRDIVQIYPDTGRLNTCHLCSNAIIEFDDAHHARCTSTYVVLQATATLPLQAVMTGRYHDRFEKADGEWRFSERRWNAGLVGDLSAHLKTALESFT